MQRNKALFHSDVDLLLVLDGDVDRYTENWKLSDLVLHVLKRNGLFVSFVVLFKDEFQRANLPLLVSIEDEAMHFITGKRRLPGLPDQVEFIYLGDGM